jgi:hypothetical protein
MGIIHKILPLTVKTVKKFASGSRHFSKGPPENMVQGPQTHNPGLLPWYQDPWGPLAHICSINSLSFCRKDGMEYSQGRIMGVGALGLWG